MTDELDLSRLVLIGGVMRSGTTLLQRVVANNPICTPLIAEFYPFHAAVQMAVQWEDYPVKDDPDHYLLQLSRSAVNFMASRVLVRCRTVAPSASVVVWKDPFLSRNFVNAARLFPDCKFVLAVRNPEDIFLSALTVRTKVLTQGGRSTEDYFDLAYGIINELASQKPALGPLRRMENVKIVSYERIERRDSLTAIGLSEFLGFDVNYDVGDASAWVDSDSPFYTERSFREVTMRKERVAAEIPPGVLRSLREKFADYYELSAGDI